MKKLMSILLCVSLLTGICTAAVAEDNNVFQSELFSDFVSELVSDEEKYVQALNDIGKQIAAALKSSKLVHDGDNVILKEFISLFVSNFNNLHQALADKNNSIVGILKKYDESGSVDKVDYEKGLAIAKSAYDLIHAYEMLRRSSDIPVPLPIVTAYLDTIVNPFNRMINDVQASLRKLEKYVQ